MITLAHENTEPTIHRFYLQNTPLTPGRNEINSTSVGEMVMVRLKKLDHIAYIRFASVYREFADITMLKEEVDNLANHSVLNNHDQLPLIPPEEIIANGKIPRRLRR